MIRIVIADDCAIVREGMKRIFSETGDIQLVGEAENALAAFHLAKEGFWDVLLLELAIPGWGSGLDLLKELKRDSPRRAVLVMSFHPEDQYALLALRAGASGYLNKRCAPEELVRGIRRVFTGSRYISSALAEIMADRLDDPDSRPPHEALSQRELEVLVGMASGKSSTEIASGMRLSIKTVSTYRARILQKLQLKVNAELIRYAIQYRLIPTLGPVIERNAGFLTKGA
jgi:DNA-binding NarL/FixJ family response regulator